jgi:serine/threonine protein kinase
MVFNMITGTPPFFESDPFDLHDKISRGLYKSNTPMFDQTVQGDLRSFIDKMIVVDPEIRVPMN